MQQYIPLHRKYRPQVFEDLVGQETNAIIAQRMIFEHKIPNAFLFAGIRGSGKTSLARIVAKAMNCDNPVNNNPCNKCNTCKMITDDKYPDVIELDAGSNSNIDSIRELIQSAGYGAKYGKYKVIILDEAHNISKKAFDVMLKTLEEPSPTVKFIFCTTEPMKIPDTIKSRCQTYTFNRIDPEAIKKRISTIANKENIKLSDKALQYIVSKSSGSVRDALQLLEQIAIMGEEEGMILTASDDELKTFISYVFKGNYARAIEYKNNLRLPDDVFLDDLKQFLCKCIINDDAIIQGDNAINMLNLAIEWSNRTSRALNALLQSDIYIIKMIDMFSKKEEKKLSLLDTVFAISKKINGYHKKINDEHYIITSQRGNQLNIVTNENNVDKGYYCVYPENTTKLINSNQPISKLIGSVISKKG